MTRNQPWSPHGVKKEAVDLSRASGLRATAPPISRLDLTPDGERTSVRFSFLPDPNLAEHAELIEKGFAAAHKLFDVEYYVELNLDHEWQAFAQQIALIYQTKAGAAVRETKCRRLDDTERNGLLAPLASYGWHIFNTLFRHVRSEHHTEADLPMVQAAVEAALARPHRIEVHSPTPLFPWALLYDRDFSEARGGILSWKHFWGFQHVVQQMPRGVAGRDVLPPAPRLVAAICPHTDGGNRHSDLRNAVTPIEIDNVADLLERLCDFDGHCLYFYGHAEQTEPPSKVTSKIKMCATALSVADLENSNAPTIREPLVLAFLNGCETAPISAWNDKSIAGYLCLRRKGRISCLLTVAPIPEASAARFGYFFWREFMKPCRVGEALLRARREMIEDANNPLGLLYTYFGLADLGITPTAAEGM